MVGGSFSEKHSDAESLEIEKYVDTPEDRNLVRKVDLQYVPHVIPVSAELIASIFAVYFLS
jgi:hypothetical protein